MCRPYRRMAVRQSIPRRLKAERDLLTSCSLYSEGAGEATIRGSATQTTGTEGVVTVKQARVLILFMT
ncbi:hypothetical protein SKAU_G00109810 [Synaphobranchus kaupii]|uniref:Uncharacterized protein n=1 Tax=Synaphobranchus kaupii TaxID=118154 RepID=A0A9Q1J8B2_SYNKA|nr:hypothetical protein SKAU_G00109810 [Synaphobranchus kaupii]